MSWGQVCKSPLDGARSRRRRRDISRPAESETVAYTLPEPFTLLGGHGIETLGPIATVASRSTDEDPAQCQQSQPLPERDLAPAENWRQQPVPQQLHDFAADETNQQYRRDSDRGHEEQFASPCHVRFLMLSSIRRKYPAAVCANAAPHNVCATGACSRSRRSPRITP